MPLTMRRWTRHPGRSRLCLSQPHDLDDPQQRLLLQRQPVHRNRHATPPPSTLISLPIDRLLLQLLKPFSPSLVPGRLRLVRPTPALSWTTRSPWRLVQRQAWLRPPLQPADGQIGQGVEYLRCSSISLPRAVVPIVDMVSSSSTAPPHSVLIHSYSIASCSSSSDLSRPASCPGASSLLSGLSPPSWTTRSPRRLPQRQARRRPPPQPANR